MKDRIKEICKNLGKEKDIKILFAVENGSRAWRMDSKDSDYDVRFVFVRPLNEYIQINKPGEVIDAAFDKEGNSCAVEGSFIDISIEKIKNKSFLKENSITLKKLGRINNFYEKNQNKPGASLVISGDFFRLYFDQTVDLNLIKENLIKRQNKYENELSKISQRLSNNSFIKRAPKNIVDQEKTNYSDLKNDIQKISLTIESL